MENSIEYQVVWEFYHWEEWTRGTSTTFDLLKDAESYMNSIIPHPDRRDVHIEKVTTTYERL